MLSEWRKTLNTLVVCYVGSARRFIVQHLLRSHEIGDISALSTSVLQVGFITVVTVDWDDETFLHTSEIFCRYIHLATIKYIHY